nr:PadR family transcriptional regulator [Nocardia harenae]
MVGARKVDNLLALAVLSVMVERPMHRYEIAATLRSHGKDQDMDIKWGSLYTVVRNMEKAGFLEVVGSERAGARPERVIYRITEAGRSELVEWTRDLVARPQREQSRFVAGLSVLAVLSPDEVVTLLEQRAAALEETLAEIRAQVGAVEGLPRLFLIETEFGVAMLEAELSWVRGLRAELADGTFPEVDTWRQLNRALFDPAAEGWSTERG